MPPAASGPPLPFAVPGAAGAGRLGTAEKAGRKGETGMGEQWA